MTRVKMYLRQEGRVRLLLDSDTEAMQPGDEAIRFQTRLSEQEVAELDERLQYTSAPMQLIRQASI